MKRLIIFLLIFVCIITFSAAQTADNTPFREEGTASWYGREFEGLRTASGEIFSSSLYTAAHRTLPFGTLLTVTNTQNMRQVNVRVNDRGPFTAARIIDLSEAAAAALDIIGTGLAPVIISRTDNVALGPVTDAVAVAQPVSAAPIAPAPAVPQLIIPPPSSPPPALPAVQADHPVPPITTTPAQVNPQAPSPTRVTAAPAPSAPAARPFFPAPPARIIGNIPPSDSTSTYRIQVGSFRVQGNAVETFVKLRAAGLNPSYEQSGEFIRVVLSGLRAQDIIQTAQSLGNAGFPEVMIRQENKGAVTGKGLTNTLVLSSLSKAKRALLSPAIILSLETRSVAFASSSTCSFTYHMIN